MPVARHWGLDILGCGRGCARLGGVRVGEMQGSTLQRLQGFQQLHGLAACAGDVALVQVQAGHGGVAQGLQQGKGAAFFAGGGVDGRARAGAGHGSSGHGLGSYGSDKESTCPRYDTGAGGRDVRNTSVAVRAALPFAPSHPKPCRAVQAHQP